MSTALFMATYAVLWILIILAVVLQLGILRHLGYLYQVADPMYRFVQNETHLTIGRRLPSIPLIDKMGKAVQIREIVAHRRSLLLVVQHPCVPCSELMAAISNGTLTGTTAGTNIVLIVQGTRTESEALSQLRWLLKDFSIPNDVALLIDFSRGAWRKWEVRTPPYAILLDDRGKVVDKRDQPSLDDIMDTLRNIDRASFPQAMEVVA